MYKIYEILIKEIPNHYYDRVTCTIEVEKLAFTNDSLLNLFTEFCQKIKVNNAGYVFV